MKPTNAPKRMADDSSDDEAPEVVSKDAAKEQAMGAMRQQRQARAATSTKRKRSAKTEVKNEAREEVQELDADVLAALAAQEEEDGDEQKMAEAAEAEAAKNAKKLKSKPQNTHVRQFGSVHVATLEAVDAVEDRKLSDSAMAFLQRKMAPTRARRNVLEGHASRFTMASHKQQVQ